MKTRTSRRVLAVTTPVVVVADLSTKVWASHALRNRSYDLPGPVDLRLAHNRGIAFGAFESAPPALILAVTGTVTVVLAIAAWRHELPALPAGFMLGGAIANVVDRIQGGSVVDLLHTGWWPTFNLADVRLNIGIGLLLLTSFGDGRSNGNATEVQDATSTGRPT